MRKTTRGIAAAGTAIIAGIALALAVPVAASAHVSLDTNTAEAGSYALLTFKVPNESTTASTTKIELSLPTDTPFTSVRFVPVPGWTTELVTTTLPEAVTVGETEITEAVTSVVWTATDGAIVDGSLQLFPVSLGAVPDVGSVVLPVSQTYSDGRVVEWSDPEADAEHPAPVLYVNDAPAEDHHGGAAEETTDGEHADGSTDAGAADSTDTIARVFGIAGLAVGAIALVVAVMLRRRPTSTK